LASKRTSARLAAALAPLRRDPLGWAAACGIRLRPYQAAVALAIKDSIVNRRGRTFVVVLPRQSGKNEIQRHLFGWLLLRAAGRGGSIVSVSPTFKPQTINVMERMRATLDDNLATRGRWRASRGFLFRYQRASLQFFSGERSANVVGATADLLLSVDEAQDIEANKFDKDFDPMTASTNATRVFWGTVWTSQTLLARQMHIARMEQEQDGVQRLFFYTAEDVRALVPEYAAHVDRVVSEKGRQHPLVRTQYFCEEIDAQSGMFPARRRALMQSDDGRSTTDDAAPTRPPPNTTTEGVENQRECWSSYLGEVPRRGGGGVVAFCIDVAGQDEALLRLDGMGNPGRDSTALSIIEIDLSTLPTLQAPTYRVLERHAWQGQSHVTVFGALKALAERWRPGHIVIDATGVGEGLWAMLDRHFPTRVRPVKFTQQAKSELGYGFLAIIESGRFHDCCPTAEVDLQYAHCLSEILIGPAHTMRWGVPEGRRGPSGELIHDDFVIADALTAALDRLPWAVSTRPLIVRRGDPLDEMSRIG
jgi:hypothetical protein